MSTDAATTWPPQVLDRERWGHLIATTLDLMAAARERGRFPQSLLLVGPPGLGRELAALTAAAALTCTDGGRPGCTCSSCPTRTRSRTARRTVAAPMTGVSAGITPRV